MNLFENTPLGEYAKRLKSLQGTEDKIFKLVLDNIFVKELITHLNTEEQLGKERVDSLGAHLGVYSQFDPKGRAGKFITLHDKGDFWDSWKLEIREALIIIDANPFKEDTNLFDQYGEDVLGLTDENLQIFIIEAQKLYVEYYERTLLPNN